MIKAVVNCAHIKNYFAVGLVSLSLSMAVIGDSEIFGDWGIETKNISQQVTPGDDFYTYVNHGWLDTATIPQGMPRYNAFLQVHLKTEDQLDEIVEDLAAGKVPKAPGGEQIYKLYKSFMGIERIDALGIKPIQTDLTTILQLPDKKALAQWMAKPNVSSIVATYVYLHPKHPDRHTVFLSQAGLTLPDREYYLSAEEPYPGIREDYQAYIETTLKRAGIENAADRAVSVLAFETALAEVHWESERRRDRIANYHPMSRTELQEFAPEFDWAAFFASFGAADQDEFIVETDTAVQETAGLFERTPLNVLRDYLAFQYINNHADYLSSEFDDANFAFFGTRLQGIEEQRERPRRALNLANDVLGEVMGRLYVHRFFPLSAKEEMESYIPFIREAFRGRLQQSFWMDETTRQQALLKLKSFGTKIGFPDKWKDYSSIKITDDDLVGNIHRAGEWHRQDQLAALAEPRRDWEWSMNPQRVNAYYSYMRNEIVFPAAILQAPFFQAGADHAVNFGAIGAVIGHELGHGFDDQGSKSDGDGVLRDWWTEQAREKFDVMGDKLATQYNQYEPLPGMHINGRLTLGENIGDLGGLAIAYSAYRNFVEQELNGNDKEIDGFSGDQRFFMAWAQLWREINTEGYLRKKLLTDSHSPNDYRVNGIVRNMDAWYLAFDVKEGDKLYLPPEQRLQIW